jgi:hypothetical protein
MNDKLLIFEDTKGTGKADKMTVFADGLHCPTGFEFWKDGVIVAQAPSLMFLKDTTGGDKCNFRQRIVGGLDTADTHHTANSFVLTGAGCTARREAFHRRWKRRTGPPVLPMPRSIVMSLGPRVSGVRQLGFATPGHVFDRWGQDCHRWHRRPYHAALLWAISIIRSGQSRRV